LTQFWKDYKIDVLDKKKYKVEANISWK